MEASGNTTIASFIERFRREPPRSREERSARAKEDKGLFWWQDSCKQGAQPYAEVDEYRASSGSHELLVEDLGDEFLNVDELNRRADEILARHKHLLEPADDEEEDCKNCARSPGGRSPRLPLESSPTAVSKGHGNSRPSDDVPLNTSLLSRASTASRRSNAADSFVYSEASSDDNLLGLAFVDAENPSEWTPPPSPPPQTSRRAKLSSPPPSPPPPPPPPVPLPPSSGHRRRRQNRVQGSDQFAESHVHVFVHVDPVKPTTTVPNSRRLLTPLALDAQDNRIDALHPVSASASESPSHLSQAVEQHLDEPLRANPGLSEPMAECDEEATSKQNAQAISSNKIDEHIDHQLFVGVEQDITERTTEVVNEGNMDSDDDDQVSVNELLDTILQTVIDITEQDNGVASPKTAEEVARSTAHGDTANTATSPPRQQAAAVALSPIRCDETETATSPIVQETRDSAISPLQVSEMGNVSIVPFPCKTMETAASPLGIEVAEIATSPMEQHVREAAGSPEHHNGREAATSPMRQCAKDEEREALVQRLEVLRARLREIEREEAELEKLCNP